MTPVMPDAEKAQGAWPAGAMTSSRRLMWRVLRNCAIISPNVARYVGPRHSLNRMPKQIPQKEMDTLLEAVARFPEGVSVAHIHASLPVPVPRRTLQRRLARLVEQGRLSVEGRGPGVRYRIRGVTGTMRGEIAPFRVQVFGEVYVPVSPEADAIKQAVRRPIQDRHPVGYHREFLDAYRPNATHYLPTDIRERLLGMGRSPDGDRPAGTYARQILGRLLIDLSWNSSRLEGNTYSLLETERLLELGEAAAGKDAREAQMIRNHKAGIEFLVETPEEIGFNRHTVLNLHALLSDNLLADPQACGRLRVTSVGIAETVYHPLAVPQLIEEAFDQILDTAASIRDPFEQAFFAMVQLPYLQPFEDVNKRVSRLAANLPLIRDNLCPLSFVDVPERAYIDGMLGVYELNRVELLRDVFTWAYERSCARYSAIRKSLGEPDRFRMRHRALIAAAVAGIVRGRMDKPAAIALIRARAQAALPEAERARFIEVVETEVIGLHEGNIARYRLRPSEYQAWRGGWH